MKRLLLVTLFSMLCCSSVWAQEPLKEKAAVSFFVKGNFAYEQGDYKKASDFYEQIVSQDMQSGAIYYNLANSYFKQKELGRAILSYERARRILPRDADVRTNYQYALSQKERNYRLPQRSFLEKVFAQNAESFTLQELFLLSLLLVILLSLAGLASLYLSIPKRIKGYLIVFLIVLAFYYGVSFFWISKHQQDLAIVLYQTDALFEPRPEATVHFAINQGEEMKILQNSGEWVKVKRIDDKIGWIQRKFIERIEKMT